MWSAQSSAAAQLCQATLSLNRRRKVYPPQACFLRFLDSGTFGAAYFCTPIAKGAVPPAPLDVREPSRRVVKVIDVARMRQARCPKPQQLKPIGLGTIAL